MKYIVRFEFRNENGEWKDDYFSNNGLGWTIREAEEIASQMETKELDGLPVRNVRINEM